MFHSLRILPRLFQPKVTKPCSGPHVSHGFGEPGLVLRLNAGTLVKATKKPGGRSAAWYLVRPRRGVWAPGAHGEEKPPRHWPAGSHSHTAANGGTMGQGAGLLLHSMRHAFLDANRHPVNCAQRLGNHRISNIKKGPDGGHSNFRCWQHVSSFLLRLDSQTALILAFKLPGITQIKVVDGHSASIQPLMQFCFG